MMMITMGGEERKREDFKFINLLYDEVLRLFIIA